MNWKKWYRECALCPRECGVNRLEGRRGFCGQTAGLKVARAVLHMWEEPCISGSRGSGTVFFTGCHLGCVFCQNGQISRGSAGKEISVIRLARIFMELQEKGAHNINLVTPTHFVPHIIEALRISRKMGLKLPIVYNTGGFEKVDTLELLDGWIDVYLTDFKFMDVHLSGRYAHEEGYSFYAAKALEEMYRQTGEPVFDENGLMTKGIIVRHMVLPGQSMDSRQIVDFLYENYGDKIYLSLMNQYTPSGPLEKYPKLQKRVKRQVYERLIGYTIRKGVENAYIQEGSTAKESFIPDFNGEGV